jgi:4-hydroxy-tetrahydrodipicolinate synthase
VIKTVVDEANGKVPVLAGTAQAGTKETLKMSKYAEEVGADGVQIVLPHYQLPSEEGMYQHYKTVAEGIGIGIMVYNNPAMTKAWIKPELMVRLSEIENIIADKENANDVVDYYWMQKLVDSSKMKIFCGLGELMFSFEAVYGCPGFVTWIANFAPMVSYELYEAARERDFDKVRRVIHRLTPLLEFVGKICTAHGPHTGVMSPTYTRGYTYVSVLKECLNLVGLYGGGVRLPLLGLTLSEKEELKKILADLGLPVK